MIIVYSKPNCVWCSKAKSALDIRGIEYQELIFEEDFNREHLIQLRVPLTLPQIFDSMGNHIGGYEKLLEYLENTSTGENYDN